MSVLRIEEYGDVLKVILKPTKAFPIGCFYCDADAIDLVQSYNWHLVKIGRRICVSANIGTPSIGRETLLYHQEYAKRILGYYPDYIDHIDGLEIDNRDANLNIVSQQQNARNKPSVGYTFDVRYNPFRPNYTLMVSKPLGVATRQSQKL